MDAQITLTTSDAPPVSLSVTRAALASHSNVFADMLALNLKSEANAKSIPVTETEKNLTPFLLMVHGQERELNETLSRLDEAGWEIFAQLTDKYDCASGRFKVQAKIWEIEAKNQSAAFAFTLATLIDDDDLICYTAKRAVRLKDLEDPGFHAAREWKERLVSFPRFDCVMH